MTLSLAEAVIGKIEISGSKEGGGGTYAKAKLTCKMTKTVRRAMSWGETDEKGKPRDNWPPPGETQGSLVGSLAATSLILTARQSVMDGSDEVQAKLELANDFTWFKEDDTDQTYFRFSARTLDQESALKLISYKFAVGSGVASGKLTYEAAGSAPLLEEVEE
jgi:hypothetical protein